MDEQTMQLLIDMHKSNNRQGPGGEAETKKALQLAGLDKSRPLKVADIGCGTGAGTIQLAKLLDAKITAVDFLQDFLDVLEARAKDAGVANCITTLNCSMDDLPFNNEEFDLIWSEGAIYNMGYAAGVADWKRFLKPKGLFVVSEICWLTAKRPDELQSYWNGEYPEIDLSSKKIAILEDNGFKPIAHFVLPPHCWSENYYRPLREGYDAFLERNNYSAGAKELVEYDKQEAALFDKYKDFYSYGVYIAEKV